MKERPILMSRPMVRALLDGSKTQTRRIVKSQPIPNHRGKYNFTQFTDDEGIESYWANEPLWWTRCPYGKTGDILFVREAFSYTNGYGKDDVGSPIWYWADGNPEYGDFTNPKPSIHMPRWASRILPEIADVRIERLQDISGADALAEGIPERGTYPPESDPEQIDRYAYRDLWETINGAGSWNLNPWVWAISFRKIKG